MSLHHGDCLEVMAGMEPESVDAIVTDPPYGLGFMGKHWDHGVPAREFWAEMLRVARPSAYLLAFGGTRTVHRIATNIEDAGWIIRDMLVWGYASGFPKSKASLKPAWEPIVMARKPGPLRMLAIDECRIGVEEMPYLPGELGAHSVYGRMARKERPAWSSDAKQPSPRGPVSGHVEGSLSLDMTLTQPDHTADRSIYDQPPITATSMSGEPPMATSSEGCPDFPEGTTLRHHVDGSHSLADAVTGVPLGRWPANVVLTDPIFDGGVDGVVGGGETVSGKMLPTPVRSGERTVFGQDADAGYTTIETYGDSGTYSRFFLIPKADRADREPVMGRGGGRVVSVWGGDEDDLTPGKKSTVARQNVHPTVKPVDLMRHLVRLVTPSGGTVLDPFLGSGTTALAAEREGFAWVGIEREAEYVAIAEARLNGTQRGMAL